jgi:Arc/MetJ-type ribon-helix-helix transcriptional regulator
MAYEFPPDVRDQLRQRMATGQYATEDDVLRDAFRALKLQNEDVAAVRQAIADMEAGDRGKPFDEFVEEFRKKHNIPQDV